MLAVTPADLALIARRLVADAKRGDKWAVGLLLSYCVGLNLLIEVTGEKRKDKAAKVATARTLWAPAINNHGGFGRWAFLEIADPWDAQNLLRSGPARIGLTSPLL